MPQDIKANKNMGANIKKARIAAGLTQEQLAAKMQTAGCDISRGTLAKIEAGIRHVSLEELRTIKAILKVEFDDLLDS
ncbi:helix-turn-helix domain-containing protein [Oscillospiraceae bacterium OttesenSCG-928-G22]|nr:helix-turn-helix domain-containing protein [Oscillospiraceae bacterium OttesenSCG-928-G22]